MANFGTALAIVRDARSQMPDARGFAHALVRSEELGVRSVGTCVRHCKKWQVANRKWQMANFGSATAIIFAVADLIFYRYI